MAQATIIAHDELPEDAFRLMQLGFPDDEVDQRAFWEAHPVSAHALVHDDGQLVSHAGMIARTLRFAGTPVDLTYIEYVCAEPRRHGYGSIAMRAVDAELRRRRETLAALATGSPEFYTRLGWKVWRGATSYRAADGMSVPTPDECIMVLDLGANVDVTLPIECDWRAIGDIW